MILKSDIRNRKIPHTVNIHGMHRAVVSYRHICNRDIRAMTKRNDISAVHGTATVTAADSSVPSAPGNFGINDLCIACMPAAVIAYGIISVPVDAGQHFFCLIRSGNCGP